MILEDVSGKFINWSNQDSLTAKFIGIESINVKGEMTKMGVFEKGNDTIYIGNYQILRVLEHNYDRGIVGHVLKIKLIGEIETKSGNKMLNFQVETLEDERDEADSTKGYDVKAHTEDRNTPGVPF